MTFCSSIWGGSAPSTPYCADENGHGPAWANSLFEDNAEYGYGMFLAQNTLRERNIEKLEKIAEENADVKPAVDKFIETKNDAAANKVATDKRLRTFWLTRNIFQRSPAGSSAATAGHTTSASAVLTTCSLRAKM